MEAFLGNVEDMLPGKYVNLHISKDECLGSVRREDPTLYCHYLIILGE